MTEQLAIDSHTMYTALERLSSRPAVWSHYTAADLWTDPYISGRMLECHLNPDIDLSSRRLEFIERSAAWIGDRFELRPGKSVADFGCGPGLYTTRLARTGAGVTGIDFSPRSIAHARSVAGEEGLTIDYVVQNYLEFETELRFDLITMIMCDYCALSPAQRRSLLDSFRRLLRPGGAVLIDVYTEGAYARRDEACLYGRNLMDGFWAGRDYFGFLCTFKYAAEQVVLDQYTIIEPERTRVVYNWLQYFSRESLVREFNTAGFDRVEIIGDVAGGEYNPEADEMAVVAGV